MEATLLAMEKEGAQAPEEPAPDAYICSIGKEASFEAARLATELRTANLSIELDYEGRSLKAQMKQANKMQARFALILGDEELAAQSARAREMSTGEESTIPMAELADKLREN